jgi:hypothetical protein
MKLKYLTLIFFLLPTIVTAGNQEAQIQKSLEMWQPKEVRVQNGVLSIISKERRVTDTIYRAMITAGLCMGTMSQSKSLDGISEIRVLNQFGRQGYVFEGGNAECSEILKMPGRKTELYVLGRTHMHTNQ